MYCISTSSAEEGKLQRQKRCERKLTHHFQILSGRKVGKEDAQRSEFQKGVEKL